MNRDETESEIYRRTSEEPGLIMERMDSIEGVPRMASPMSTNAGVSTPANIEEENGYIDPIALYSLAAQHLSVTWTQRTAEFASYLFLIDLFPTTLLPSALYGFFSTLVGVLFGGNAGSFVDISSASRTRLQIIRIVILVGKLSVASLYTFLLILLVKYSSESALAGEAIRHGGHPIIWTLFSLAVLSSCSMKLSDIAMSVAIERDWVTTIADGSDARLTRLNLWLRRIDLGCKLLAPLFAGLLSSTVGNITTVAILGGIALGGLCFELLWTNIVWKRFPVLVTNNISQPQPQEQVSEQQNTRLSPALRQKLQGLKTRITTWVQTTSRDWALFIQSPVFPSSLAISLLYFTTLSFDGTMISWLKTNNYSDTLISGMRGIAVCTGLAGTVVMPFLERKIGLARAGNWSIWSEALSLVPVVVSFYVGSRQGTKAPAWNQALLFGGMAASRIGLWSFDLCQLKLLQITLADHSRRNTMNGLQYSLQNILDLLRYIMVIILSRPAQFKYTAALSFGAVVSGACLYLIYLRRERGHILHTDWFTTLTKKLL